MSTAPFPKTLDPLKMVDQRVDLAGKIALNQLDRLQEMLLDDGGEVKVRLQFGKDEQGIRFIRGTLRSTLLLECQRCLQPVTYDIDAGINLGLVFSEVALKNLPNYYDPLLLATAELAVWQMVEEELILSLPIAAVHPERECEMAVQHVSLEQEPTVRRSPFEVLGKLKDK